MKRLVNIVLLVVIFSSCSGKTQFYYKDNSSLKKESQDLESSVQWKTELEGDILSKKVEGCDGIASSVEVGPSNIFASGAENEYVLVYPRMEGLGLLDTSIFDGDAKSVVDGFCQALIDNESMESFIKRDNMYTLVMFLYDLESRLGKNVSVNRFMIGEPFRNLNMCMCPVRFFRTESNSEYFKKTDSYFDVVIYLLKDDSTYKINQIELESNEDDNR